MSGGNPAAAKRTSLSGATLRVSAAVAGAIVMLGFIASELRRPAEPEIRGRFDQSTVQPLSHVTASGSPYQRVDFNLLAGFPYGEVPGIGVLPSSSYEIPREVTALSGRRVAVSGYMLPLDITENGVASFLLNASFDMCYYGAPTLPNQFVVVFMSGGRRAPFVHTPITAFGTLSVREERRDGRVVSLYGLEADGIALRH